MVSPDIDKLASEYWREWLSSAALSDETLRPYASLVTLDITEELHRGHLDKALLIEQFYCYIEPYCKLEPLATLYGYYRMLIHFTFADSYYIIGRFDDVFFRLQQTRDTLTQIDSRREQLGLDRRPNSEIRFYMLGLAAAIAVDPSRPPGELPYATDTLIDDFHAVVRQVMQFFETHSFPEQERFQNVMSGLTMQELEICKLAYAYYNDVAEECVRQYNERYGQSLSCGLRDYQSRRQPETAWPYWEFEIFKLRTKQELTLAEFRYLQSARDESLRSTFHAFGLQQKQRLCQRQDEVISHALKAAQISRHST